MSRVGIFLDRDGTVNYEVDYLRSPADLVLIPRSAEAIKEANFHGWKVFIVTNQSGIARGILTEKELADIHSKLSRELQNQGAQIDAIYYCPHHPSSGEPPYLKDCGCRKPKIGMLSDAAREYDIDLRKSFVIGDKMIDVQTAINSGARSVLVLTGYGREERKICGQNNVKIDFVAENLYDAIQIVKRTILHIHPAAP